MATGRLGDLERGRLGERERGRLGEREKRETMALPSYLKGFEREKTRIPLKYFANYKYYTTFALLFTKHIKDCPMV